MKDANKRLEYNKSRQKINNESMINNTASKVGILKFTGVAALALGSVALATQNAQALSPLAIVNGITASGGVGVSKNILYGDEPDQDLDIYYPKPLAQAMKAQSASMMVRLMIAIRWWCLSTVAHGRVVIKNSMPLLVRVWRKQVMSPP